MRLLPLPFEISLCAKDSSGLHSDTQVLAVQQGELQSLDLHRLRDVVACVCSRNLCWIFSLLSDLLCNNPVKILQPIESRLEMKNLLVGVFAVLLKALCILAVEL